MQSLAVVSIRSTVKKTLEMCLGWLQQETTTSRLCFIPILVVLIGISQETVADSRRKDGRNNGVGSGCGIDHFLVSSFDLHVVDEKCNHHNDKDSGNNNGEDKGKIGIIVVHVQGGRCDKVLIAANSSSLRDILVGRCPIKLGVKDTIKQYLSGQVRIACVALVSFSQKRRLLLRWFIIQRPAKRMKVLVRPRLRCVRMP